MMKERITGISDVVPKKDKTYRKVIQDAENHEIHLWRVVPGGWIYPHTHPHSDDIWYIIQGGGDYYLDSDMKKKVKPGDMVVASPGDIHGIFNPGPEDIVILSILAPLPVEIEAAPDFDYPA